MSDITTLPLFARKICVNCGESKPLSEFHKQGNSLRAACKVCTNAQNRSIYQKNHEEHLESKRNYRAENKEARRATVQKYDKLHVMKRRAHDAVKKAIQSGRLPKASDCLCQNCGDPASIYHHHSYEREHRLDVQPVCRTCHGKEHWLQ